MQLPWNDSVAVYGEVPVLFGHLRPWSKAYPFASLKVADVLQCPSLRNAVVEEVKRLVGSETSASDSAAAHLLVKAAQLGNTEISNIILELRGRQDRSMNLSCLIEIKN